MKKALQAAQADLQSALNSASDPQQKFQAAFVRAAVDVANHVATKASRHEDRLLRSYATALKHAWRDDSTGKRLARHLPAAYFTLRSFIAVVAATSPAARSARTRCGRSLRAIAEQLGAAAADRIDMEVESSLAARHVPLLQVNARGLPHLQMAWRYVGAVLLPPAAKVAAVPRAPAVKKLRRPSAHSAPPVFREAPAAAPAPAGATAAAEAQPDERWNLPRSYEVWFGTNRAPVDTADVSKGFSNERDPGGVVHHGTCSVYIPRAHQLGSTGTAFWKRWLKLKFTDDHLRLQKVRSFGSSDDFLAALRTEISGIAAEDERSVLVYIHGYNTSFEQAALRAAQIGFDLKVPTTAFYSWPSKAAVAGYPADIARVEASEPQIADFLTSLAARAGATRVHVIAHSMGNRGFARAIARILSRASADSGIRFGQIILAAPDLDVDLFKQLAAAYPSISDRTTMYVSARDRALGMSSWLQDSHRAGFTPPVTVLDGIDTVEVTDIDLTMLGHGYFAEARAVLSDIKDLLDGSKPPEKRLAIASKVDGTARFWVIRA